MIAASTIFEYGTSMVSAMMKATAPMTGGMIWPPMDEVASTPPAKADGEAEALHQRNRELARGDHVGDAGARDRAHERGGGHADLAGAALLVAEHRHRDVVEEIDDAGLLHEGAEQDEQEDVGGGNERRRAVDALRSEGHVLDHLLERIAAMVERGRKPMSEQAIGQEQAGDDRKRRSHHAPDEIDQDGERRRCRRRDRAW